MKNIDEYGQFTVDLWQTNQTADYLNPDLKSLFCMTAGLAGESGEVIEHLKKYVRDGVLDLDALKKELGDVIYYWARICRYFQLEPSEVVAENMQKLISRKNRNVLHGSGDNR